MALNVEVGDVVLRPFRSPESDYAGMAAANQRTRDAAGMNEVVTAESLARDYAYLVNSDLDHDLLVAERDGSIVGYCRVEWRDLENGSRTFAAIALLDPTASDPAIYRPMLEWAETRLADKARAIPVDSRRPSTMRVYTLGTETAPHGRPRVDRLGAHRPWLRDGPADPRRHPGRPDAGGAGRAAHRPR